MAIDKECMPTRDVLSRYLDYNADTGVFTWKITRGRVKPGDIAGTKATQGHLTIRLGNSSYTAHRLAWLFATGAWPHRSVRHRNGDLTDNRFANLVMLNPLRDRDPMTRKPVAPKRNQVLSHGVTPMHFRGDGSVRYDANVVVDGKVVFLGRFQTEEEAKDAFRRASGQDAVPFFGW